AAFLTALIVLSWGTVGVTAAQVTSTPRPLTCAQLLPLVRQNLSTGCSDVNRDQVCYGNKVNQAQFQDNATPVPFVQTGDVAPLAAIKSIYAGPLNLDRGEWGLTVLKAQVNLPGTTAGQVVSFVLYGDTNVQKIDPAQATIPCIASTTRATYMRGSPSANGD